MVRLKLHFGKKIMSILKFETLPISKKEIEEFDSQIRMSYDIQDKSYLWGLDKPIVEILKKSVLTEEDRQILLDGLR